MSNGNDMVWDKFYEWKETVMGPLQHEINFFQSQQRWESAVSTVFDVSDNSSSNETVWDYDTVTSSDTDFRLTNHHRSMFRCIHSDLWSESTSAPNIVTMF